MPRGVLVQVQFAARRLLLNFKRSLFLFVVVFIQLHIALLFFNYQGGFLRVASVHAQKPGYPSIDLRVNSWT